jgi:hypothetical protein
MKPTEHDEEFEPWPGETVDPIRTADVVTEVLGLHARVVALLNRRSLN